MNDALMIQTPDGQPAQLILLFHGVGADKRAMAPLGQRLAAEFPQALVVSIDGTDPAGSGPGRQWFPIAGISEENRPARVAAALPQFIAIIRHWQTQSGVGTAATALIGFSQGGIMALETAASEDTVAGRVVCIGGRFARLPETPPAASTIHLLHGKADPVIHYGHTISAAEHLVRIGGDVTADVLPYVGHEINEEIIALIFERLKTHIPKRLWDAALRAENMAGPRQ